jgi:hypothetical protein
MRAQSELSPVSWLTIAGVTAAVTAADGDRVADWPDPLYTPFRAPAAPSPPELTVSLTTAPAPAPPADAVAVGDAYCIARTPGGYHLMVTPADGQTPPWNVLMSGDCRQATVHCAGTAVERDAAGTLIRNPLYYPLDQILFTYLLSSRGGLLLHAAGIEICGRGYIFPGRSGAGKSTLVRQFVEAGRAASVLSDDRVVVRVAADGRTMVHGTPWAGEARIGANRSVPLGGALHLNHGQENRIGACSARAAIDDLLPVASVLWYDAALTNTQLLLCERVLAAAPTYTLSFTPDPAVVDVLQAFAED